MTKRFNVYQATHTSKGWERGALIVKTSKSDDAKQAARRIASGGSDGSIIVDTHTKTQRVIYEGVRLPVR